MMRRLIHAATASEPRTRDQAADAITDVIRSLAPGDVALLAALLVALATSEDDSSCREAQLRALHEIAATHALRQEWLQPLHALRASAIGSEVEYLDELLTRH